MAKFKCPNCDKIHIVSKYRTYFRNKKQQNVDLSNNKEIICEECNLPMFFISEEGNFESSYSSFSGLSPLEKQKLLRKRSDSDAKKKKFRNEDFEKDYYNA